MLSGCAAGGRLLDGPPPAGVPRSSHLSDVPFFAQQALQCGPAALAMVLRHGGVAVTPEDLTPELYTPARQGSLQSELITGARRHRRLAFPIRGLDCLLVAVAHGQPVIVLQNLGLGWWPRWHYAVVVGYDLSRGLMVMHTGKTAHREVGLKTFLRTWQRADQWGLLVLKPGRMPVCAGEHDYLQAALGLQQAGQMTETVAAFDAATRRWPHSAAAWMALGNARYARGDVDAALSAFERAVPLASDNGDPLNNMAHILAERGDFQAAESAARKAVRLGGPHAATYRQTLEEIRQKIGQRHEGENGGAN